MNEIVIIGDSGHAKVIEDIATSNGFRVVAKLDDKYEIYSTKGSLTIGPTNSLLAMIEECPTLGVVIAIGSNVIRKKLVESFKLPNHYYRTLIHESATISPSAVIGLGSVVMPGAVINAGTVVGDHVIINSSSVVEHDCVVENYAHVSPNATLTGGVHVGEGTHVGASATIIPSKKIGKWAVLGAGAVVTSDLQDNVLAVGVPASVVIRED